jgi:cytochrome P450
MVIPLATPIESRKGTLLHSLHIPAHQDILIGISAANRDPIIWGEDADQWKPERWIGKTVEEVSGDRLPGIYAGMYVASCC